MSLAPDCDRAVVSIGAIVRFRRHRLLHGPILPLAEAAGIGAKAIQQLDDQVFQGLQKRP